MGDADEYDFRCPECAESIEVNGSMRDALIENGCVVCGADVSAEAFSLAGEEAGPRSST